MWVWLCPELLPHPLRRRPPCPHLAELISEQTGQRIIQQSRTLLGGRLQTGTAVPSDPGHSHQQSRLGSPWSPQARCTSSGTWSRFQLEGAGCERVQHEEMLQQPGIFLVSHLWGDDKTRSLPSGVCHNETETIAGLAGAMGPRKREHHADTGLTTCFIHTWCLILWASSFINEETEALRCYMPLKLKVTWPVNLI